MNILYIAYSCDPYKGSEDQIGWNIPFEASKTNKVFVITKIEQKESIKKYCNENSFRNVIFYYVDIPHYLKRMFIGPFYSARFMFWMKEARRLAKTLCESNKIDIIHQITPIELRAIGEFGSISDAKYIVGPLGGGVKIPKVLYRYAHSKIVIEKFRELMNTLYSIKYRCFETLKQVDCFLFSNEETKSYFEGINGDIISELGIDAFDPNDNQIVNNEKWIFLVIGRLVYIKGHEFLFRVLEDLPQNLKYEVRIIGEGPYEKYLKSIVAKSRVLSEHVVFCGRMSYADVKAEYSKANALIHPSIRDNSGNVLIEALSCGKPVIAMNAFGSKVILNSQNAWLYEGKTEQELAESFKNCIIECITNEEMYCSKCKNASLTAVKYTWNKKYKTYETYYNAMLNSKS